MTDIFEPFLSIFFFLWLGFGYQRIKPLEEQTLKRLAELVVDVFLPIFLFYLAATEMDWNTLENAPIVIALGLAIPLASYGLSTLALGPLRISTESKSSFRYGTMIGNTTFIGIPVCQALFGPIGAMYAVLYDFGTTLVSLTVGIWELKDGEFKRSWQILINPLILATALGIIFSLFNLKIPMWMDRPFEMVSGVTLPLALFLAGAQVGQIKISKESGWNQIFGQAILKLVLQPLIVFCVIFLINWTDIAARVVIIETGMPVGLITVILAKTYGADAKFASAIIFFTTLGCFVTLPLLSYLLLTW